MKTVEKTDLPSCGMNWPKKTDTREEPAIAGQNGESERSAQTLPWSIWENTGHGVQGYDSPLAG
jgi:hypothetical protein